MAFLSSSLSRQRMIGINKSISDVSSSAKGPAITTSVSASMRFHLDLLIKPQTISDITNTAQIIYFTGLSFESGVYPRDNERISSPLNISVLYATPFS